LTEAEKFEDIDIGIDSCANTSSIGWHVQLIGIVEGSSCDVYPFNDSHYDSIKSIELINVIFATETITSESIIVELNQALNFTGFNQKYWADQELHGSQKGGILFIVSNFSLVWRKF